jgi:hypothetical protein
MPGIAFLSSTITLQFLQWMAVKRPAGPAPMISMSADFKRKTGVESLIAVKVGRNHFIST